MINAKIELERPLMNQERNNTKLQLTIKELKTINTALLTQKIELEHTKDPRNQKMIQQTKEVLNKTLKTYQQIKQKNDRIHPQKMNISTKH